MENISAAVAPREAAKKKTVFVIKLYKTSSDSIIQTVKESFQSGTEKYYLVDAGKTDPGVFSICADSLIMFLEYSNAEADTLEMYHALSIGAITGAPVPVEKEGKQKLKISYRIYERYDYDDVKEPLPRGVIENILGKIDMRIKKDFGSNYTYICNMESFYRDIRERIDAAIAARKPAPAVPANGTPEQFQNDLRNIVQLKSFRRLVDKTQVVGASAGVLFRTRMTHTLEVNQIAKDIVSGINRVLGENSIDPVLTEAIALAHDLGHTPFGHVGERVIKDALSERGADIRFKHNLQSARVLTSLETLEPGAAGINPSWELVEGVMSHTKTKKFDPSALVPAQYRSYLETAEDDLPVIRDGDLSISATLEGQTVAVADEIAQREHDIEDAIYFGAMSFEEYMDYLRTGATSSFLKDLEEALRKVDECCPAAVNRQELQISVVSRALRNHLVDSVITQSCRVLQEMKAHGMIAAEGRIILKKSSRYIFKFDFVRNNGKVSTVSTAVPIITFFFSNPFGFQKDRYLAETGRTADGSRIDDKRINDYLESVVNRKFLSCDAVAAADQRAEKTVRELFSLYYNDPRLMSKNALRQIYLEMLFSGSSAVRRSAIYLGDGDIDLIRAEISRITAQHHDHPAQAQAYRQKRNILLRGIADYVSSMTDSIALQEHRKLV